MIAKLILSVVLVSGYALAIERGAEIRLWPNGAPGSEGETAAEVFESAANSKLPKRFTVVHYPSIYVFLAAKEKANGMAVVVAPGGGHSQLVIDKEGWEIAEWLNRNGIAAFVLKYRLARAAGSHYTVERDALADAARAVRTVRSRAAEWGVDPARIGFMGFSAGGEVTALIETRPARSDRAVESHSGIWAGASASNHSKPLRRVMLRRGVTDPSPRIALEFFLPPQRALYDDVELVQPGHPAEQRADTLSARDQCRRIAFATSFLPDHQRLAGDTLHALQHLAHAVAVAVAAVAYRRAAAAAQIVERIDVGAGEILDVDIVAHAGAVWGVVIGAVDRNLPPLTDDGLTGDLDQQGCVARGLADPRLGIRAGNIEVTQAHIAEIADGGQIAQYPLGHQFGGAVGVDGDERHVFGGYAAGRHSVHGRGRREHQLAHTVLHACLKQAAGRAGVIAVVFERITYRFRYDGVGGEMHDGVYVVFAQHALEQLPVTDLADDQRCIAYGLSETGIEIVERHDALATCLQLQQHVTANVACAPCDQDSFLRHCAQVLKTAKGSWK